MPRLDEAVRAGRRQALLDAASRCLARKGYRDLRVEDVCAEAGVSKGAFYGYFESKQDLFAALLTEQRAVLDRAVAGVDGSVDGLRSFVGEVLRLGGDPFQAQLRGDLWAALRTDESIREAFTRVFSERRAALGAGIEAGIERGTLPAGLGANAMAAVLLALADGLLLYSSLDPAAFRWENVREVLDLLLAGLAPEADGVLGA